MNDQLTQEQKETIERFNASVDHATLAIYNLNKELMKEVPPAGIALANALSAADLTAAIVVSNPEGTAEMVDQMLERLLEDMKLRGRAAFADYIAKRAAIDRAKKAA